MIRKLLRRVIKWALADAEAQRRVEPLRGLGFEIVINRSIPQDVIICGRSTDKSRQVIIKQIRRAKINREL